MKCFFCAEDIKDEAVVCRHCGRDVHHLRAILGRISTLEEDVAHLRTLTEKLQDKPEQSPRSGNTSPRSILRRLIPALVASVSCGGLWTYDAFNPGDLPIALPFVVPVLFGLWAGLWWRGRHTGAYFIDGSIIGTVVVLSGFISNQSAKGPIDAATSVAVTLILSHSLLYMTGGLAGDFAERKRHPAEVTPGLPEAIARRLRGRPVGGDEDRNRAIRRLADVFAALAPLLTFLGSLVTAYFTYLATVAAK